jgi:MSHA pilin protein MshD
MCIDGPTRQGGASLIELIMFIMIIGIALAGVLLVMDQITGNSAGTMARKQALSIAEALLDEVESKPYTYCDPDDANVTSATSATVGGAGCATTVEAIGPEAGETRYAAPRFDNVNDYQNFSMQADNGGIKDISNTLISGLDGYAASVVVAAPSAGLGGIAAASGVLQITVTVTGPADTQVVLDGYRTRYAPNGAP